MSHFDQEPAKIHDASDGLEIAWDGDFELRGPFFILSRVGEGAFEKVIAGYPLDDLRPVIDRAQSIEHKAAVIFGGADTLDLTPDLMDQFAHQGWDQADVRAAARAGARYSPARPTLLFPSVTREDEVEE